MAGIAIRAAARKDAETLASFCAALSAHEGDQPPGLTAPVMLRDGFGPNRAFETLVAEIEGRLLGYVLFCPVYDTQLGARGIHVADLFVVEEARRCKLARKLMSAVARRAKMAGGTFLTWNALAGNGTAEAFYGTIAQLETRTQTWSTNVSDFDALADG